MLNKLEPKYTDILEFGGNLQDSEDAGAIKLQSYLRLLVNVLIIYVVLC